MKHLGFWVVLLVLLVSSTFLSAGIVSASPPPPDHLLANPSVDQSGKASFTATTGSTGVFTNLQAGDTLLLFIAANATATISNVKDNYGGSLSLITSNTIVNSAGTQKLYLYSEYSFAHTVTNLFVNQTASVKDGLVFTSVKGTGYNTATAVDAFHSSTGHGTAITDSVTTTVAHDLIISGDSIGAAATTAASGGDTLIQSQSNSPVSDGDVYFIDASTGSQAMAMTGSVLGSWVEISVALLLGSAPATPTSLAVIATTTYSIEWSWVAPHGVVLNYTAYLSTVSPGNTCNAPTRNNVATGTVTFTTSGLSPGTQRGLNISAWNATGQSALSTCVIGITTSAPSFLEGTAVNQSAITLAWEPEVGVTLTNTTLQYGTVYGTYTNWLSLGTSAPVDAGTYTVQSLASNTTYFFAVDSWTSTSTSPLSNVAPVHTLGPPPKIVLAGVLSASAVSLTSVVVTWTAPSNVSVVNYTLYRGTSYVSPLTANPVSEGTSLSATVTGLTPNTTYFFEVDSWISATVRALYTNIAPAHTLNGPAPIVGSPVLSVAATSLTGVAVTWTAPANVTSLNYTLYWGTSYASPLTTHPVSESMALSATVTGLSPNTTYYFEVGTWTSASVRGPYSNVGVAHTFAGPAPIIFPSVLDVAATSLTAVALTWTATANVTVLNYTLYRSTSYASPLTTNPVSEGTVLDSTVTGLSPNTTYYFEVGTWTSATVRGPYSNVVPVTTFAGPAPVTGAPKLSVAAISLTSVVLTWTAPVNVTVVNYTLYRATSFSYTLVSNPVSEGLVFTVIVTGLAQNTTYYFQLGTWLSPTVRGPYSPAVPVHTFASIPPIIGPSVLAVAAIGVTSVTLDWSAPANVTVVNYTLYRGTVYASPLSGTPVSEGLILATTVTGLSPNTTYFFEVGTWTSSTVRGPYSTIVPVHTFSTTPTASGIAPVLSVVGVGTGSITVAWTAAENQTVTNYTLVYSSTGATGPFTNRISEGSSLSATVSGLTSNATYWFEVWAWDGGSLVLTSNVAPAHTLQVVTSVSGGGSSGYTLPQIVVVSTFMSLIVAGLIAAGTRKKKRNGRGYPVND